MATEDLHVEYTEDGIAELAKLAVRVNEQTENIGARRLHTLLERVLEEVSYNAPDSKDKKLIVDAAYVRERLEGISKDEDLSRYIL